MRNSHPRLRGIASGIAVAALALAGVMLTAAPAQAATFIVDTDDDGNSGMTLRAAILASNATPAVDDIIQFSPSLANNTIQLDPGKGSLMVTDEVDIQGLGFGSLTLGRASGAFDLIYVQMGAADQDFTLSGITLQGDGLAGNGRGLIVVGPSMPANYSTKDVTITGVSFNGLSTTGIGGGAAVLFTSGTTTVTDSVFNNLSAESGGALALTSGTGDLVISGTQFTGNEADADGGALFTDAAGAVHVSDTLFQLNEAGTGGAVLHDTISEDSSYTRTTFDQNSTDDDEGGAIYVLGVDSEIELSVEDSSFTANYSDEEGGAIWISSLQGILSVSGSTFAGNQSDEEQGNGIGIGSTSGGSSVGVVNSTLSEEAFAGSAIYFSLLDGGLDLAFTTIVAQHAALEIDNNDGGTFISHNILQSTAAASAIQINTADDQVDVEWTLFSTAIDPLFVNDLGNNIASKNPLLGALQNNGGPTSTRLLLTGSPALNAGGATFVEVPAFDQRGAGFPRLVGGAYDLGAIEMPPVLAATGATVPLWVPVTGGIVLLLGLGAVSFAAVRRRRATSTTD